MKVPPQEANGELLAQIGSHVQVSDRAYKVAVHRPAIAKQEPVARHFRTGNRFPLGAEDRGPLRLDTTQPVIGFRLFHGQSPFGAILPFRPKKAFPCHGARTRRSGERQRSLPWRSPGARKRRQGHQHWYQWRRQRRLRRCGRQRLGPGRRHSAHCPEARSCVVAAL